MEGSSYAMQFYQSHVKLCSAAIITSPVETETETIVESGKILSILRTC